MPTTIGRTENVFVGKSRDKIAQQLGISTGAVRSIIKDLRGDDPQSDLLREVAVRIKLGEQFRRTLKKYLIISLFTCMEHYFRSEGKYVVDNNNMAIEGLFSGDISFPLSELNQLLKEGSLTNGNVVASSINFADLNQINYVFSKLLNLDYLDYIHKLNDIDQTRYVLDGHPIPLDYGKLKEAYQMRNEIVHELKNPESRIGDSYVCGITF